MHPDRAFAWTDEPAMRAFVSRVGFAILAVAVEGRVATAHAPLAFAEDGSAIFHLARTNKLVRHLDGLPILATVVGEQAYVSPDWYGTADQVPTWNYRLVEMDGIARRLDSAALIDQLDRLSAAQEALLAPKTPWTRDKMDPARFTAMTKALAGFAMDGATIRGTAKLGQNKTAGERGGAVAGLRAIGRADIAALMETAA